MNPTAGRPTSDSTVTELRNQRTSTASSTATVGQHDTGASGRGECPIFAKVEEKKLADKNEEWQKQEDWRGKVHSQDEERCASSRGGKLARALITM